jgi:hypothetical protein
LNIQIKIVNTEKPLMSHLEMASIGHSLRLSNFDLNHDFYHCRALSKSSKKYTGVLQEAKFKKYRNFTGIFVVLQGQIS